MTKETDEEIFEIVSGLGYILLNKYNTKTDRQRKVVVLDKDGYGYDVYLKHLEEGRICIVGKNNPFTLNNISAWLKSNNRNFHISKDNIYRDSKSPLNFVCDVCLENFKMTWSNVLKLCNCPFCSSRKIGKYNNLKYLYPEISKEWSPKNKNTPENIFPKTNKLFIWKCKNCGREWSASPNQRIGNESGCPFCNRIKSKGEEKIEKWLLKNNMGYSFQHKFLDCKYKRKLPFDFYIPKFNKCIEYQGKQHYNVLRNCFFGDRAELAKRVLKDKIKSDYCLEKSIFLITIPYWEYSNIEKILNKEFFKQNILL